MKRVVGFLVLLLIPCMSEAGYSICGNETGLYYFAQGVDPANLPLCPTPNVRTDLVDEVTINAQIGVFYSMEPKYIKVVGGLMVPMLQSEKDAVDAPGLPAKQKKAAALAEIQGNNICANNTLAEISAYWDNKQSELQAAVAPVPAGAAKNAIIANMTMLIESNRTLWRYICSRTVVRP